MLRFLFLCYSTNICRDLRDCPAGRESRSVPTLFVSRRTGTGTEVCGTSGTGTKFRGTVPHGCSAEQAGGKIAGLSRPLPIPGPSNLCAIGRTWNSKNFWDCLLRLALTSMLTNENILQILTLILNVCRGLKDFWDFPTKHFRVLLIETIFGVCFWKSQTTFEARNPMKNQFRGNPMRDCLSYICPSPKRPWTRQEIRVHGISYDRIINKFLRLGIICCWRLWLPRLKSRSSRK